MKRKPALDAFQIVLLMLLFLLSIRLFFGSLIVHLFPASSPSSVINQKTSICSHVRRSASSIHDSDQDDRPRHYLSAVIMNRVFKEDQFNITDVECKQWIEYMLYAGVDHIYWYDSALSQHELQEENLRLYIEAGLLTYHRFHFDLFPGSRSDYLDADSLTFYHFQQDNSYAHFLLHYANRTTWAIEMDIDEYPFAPADTRPCFLLPLLNDMEMHRPNVSQLLVQCLIFAGNPQGQPEQWLIEKYQRRKRGTEGGLSRLKPIFKPKLCRGVSHNDPHRFLMLQGDTTVAESNALRMNHYWGARLTDFGPDTEEIVETLVHDDSMSAIASKIKQIQYLQTQLAS